MTNPQKKKGVRRVTFRDFKMFLALNCWDLHAYGDGLYDKTIYDWFMKPKLPTKTSKK